MQTLSPRESMPTVLVADDHPDVLELMSMIFQMRGYQVLTAEDGEQALAAVVQHAPDAVLMDIWMPRLDGVAATKRIRALPEHERLPIVAYTAHPRSLGADAHLFNRVCAKPCGPSELVKVITDLIAGD